MGKRKYPILKHRDVVAIATALGFTEKRQNGTSHAQWERPDDGVRGRRLMTIAKYEEFGELNIKSLISQSGFKREQFYGATKETAKKIR